MSVSRSPAWILAFAFVLGAGGAPAFAFRECTPGSPPPSGHWPDPTDISLAGTQKWEFDWKVDVEGVEVSNVRFTADLTKPRKLVLLRASLPFLPVHYPMTAPNCTGFTHGFADTLTNGDLTNFCCSEVPVSICNLPDRKQACVPTKGTLGRCQTGAVNCTGACVGTQIDTVAPLETGKGEVASNSPTADVVLQAAFQLGGYQFVQRWRFQDNGTLRPSLRAGGINDCQWHNHQIYWRFHFELTEAGTPAEVVQQCNDGDCPDLGSQGWSSNLSCQCGNRPGPATSWRVSDRGVPGRVVIVHSGSTDGHPSDFCEDTTDCGTGGCRNAREFCALTALEPDETFVTDGCNDHVPDRVRQPACAGLQNGADLAFWYFAAINHHDPCTYLPMCDPTLGTVAFGPTLRLVGSW
ncbi:MAG TPA: hypothetical protein VHQ90_26460 [Thermoanaerobaculia bacterium]|nr:hypothetical protein [Thermoanaerobaculia bacterium]